MEPFLDYEDGDWSIVFPDIEDARSLASFNVTAKIHLILYLEVVFYI